MADDATPLLCGSKQVAGHVHEGDDWNVESITETNKPGTLVGGIDVNCPSKVCWIVVHDTNGPKALEAKFGRDPLRER